MNSTRGGAVVVDRKVLIQRTALGDESLGVDEIEAGASTEWVEPAWLRREVELCAPDIHVETDAELVTHP